MRRAIIKARYWLRQRHRRLGKMAEVSHLVYFAVLAIESSYTYAKVGVLCICFTILYMMSNPEGGTSNE